MKLASLTNYCGCGEEATIEECYGQKVMQWFRFQVTMERARQHWVETKDFKGEHKEWSTEGEAPEVAVVAERRLPGSSGKLWIAMLMGSNGRIWEALVEDFWKRRSGVTYTVVTGRFRKERTVYNWETMRGSNGKILEEKSEKVTVVEGSRWQHLTTMPSRQVLYSSGWVASSMKDVACTFQNEPEAEWINGGYTGSFDIFLFPFLSFLFCSFGDGDCGGYRCSFSFFFFVFFFQSCFLSLAGYVAVTGGWRGWGTYGDSGWGTVWGG